MDGVKLNSATERRWASADPRGGAVALRTGRFMPAKPILSLCETARSSKRRPDGAGRRWPSGATRLGSGPGRIMRRVGFQPTAPISHRRIGFPIQPMPKSPIWACARPTPGRAHRPWRAVRPLTPRVGMPPWCKADHLDGFPSHLACHLDCQPTPTRPLARAPRPV